MSMQYCGLLYANILYNYLYMQYACRMLDILLFIYLFIIIHMMILAFPSPLLLLLSSRESKPLCLFCLFMNSPDANQLLLLL